MKPKYLQLIVVFLLFFCTNCEERDLTNPFDPECTVDWSPENFQATQVGNAVKLTWEQSVTNISGFKITRTVDGASATVLTTSLEKTNSNYSDTNLSGGKQHSYKLYAVAGEYSSNSVETQITPILSPDVTTNDPDDVTSISAVCGGKITNNGGTTVTEKGICYSTTENPTTNNTKKNLGTGNADFSTTITGLQSNTKYYVRAYAINSKGIGYGNQVNFTTVDIPEVTTTYPIVTSCNSATAGGNVTSDGGLTVIARGVCWSTSSTPTISDNKTTDGSGIGNFTSIITGLNPNTTYYIKAYATNSNGTAYGGQYSITSPYCFPTVLTLSASSSFCSITATGNVTSNGGATVTARGICISTTQYPTIGNYKTTNGTGTGSFTAIITGLSSNTTYYIRAYATNSTGTSYGEQYSVTTSECEQPPTVETTAAYYTSCTTGYVSGNITDEGSSSVTVKGIVWNTTGSPTVDNYMGKTNNGAGIGSFSTALTNLTGSTTYYVRAYATNSIGTNYSTQYSFTTPACTVIVVPTVTTAATTATSSTTASSGGNVTDDGGATVTAKGVVWNTTGSPTIYNYTGITSNGSGIGSFTSSITGLTCNTTYYVRAYATNSAGTSYGTQYPVTPVCTPVIVVPTVTTAATTATSSTTATSGGNVTSDGGATVTARGVCWSTSQSPTVVNSITTDGTGVGSFTSSISELTANTTYYVRAYATNSDGSGYGSQVNITTPSVQITNDFYITNASVSPTTIAPGGTISVSCDQNYSGNSTASLSPYVGYYLSTNSSWGSSDVFLGHDSSGLDASDLYDGESETLTIPSGTSAGTYYILFVADYKGEYSETNEGNNVVYKQIIISNPNSYDGSKEVYANPQSSSDFPIPDNNTTGVSVSVTFNTLPSNAVIKWIDVYYEISHPFPKDLVVYLKNANGSLTLRLREDATVSSSNNYKFTGLANNTTWTLKVADVASGDTGWIEYFGVTIYYELQ